MALDIIALHLLGDFVLQTEGMAQNKLRSAHVRALHVLCYTLPFALWGWWFFQWDGLWFALWVAVTHFAIDSRRFAANHPWPTKPIAIDQTLHLLTLALLARLFLY